MTSEWKLTCGDKQRDIHGDIWQIQAFVTQTIAIWSDLRANKTQSGHVERDLKGTDTFDGNLNHYVN